MVCNTDDVLKLADEDADQPWCISIDFIETI